MSNSNTHYFTLAVTVQNIIFTQFAVISRYWNAKVKVHSIRFLVITHVHVVHTAMINSFQYFQNVIYLNFCHQFITNYKKGFVILRVSSITWPCCISSVY